MCLKISNSASAILRSKTLLRGQTFVAYKVYWVDTEMKILRSPFQSNDIGGIFFSGGTKISSRMGLSLSDEEIKSGFIDFGFHVFIELSDAVEFVKDIDTFPSLKACKHCVVVPILCDMNNFVAAGTVDWNAIKEYSSAVFSQIEISTIEFNKAVGIGDLCDSRR